MLAKPDDKDERYRPNTIRWQRGDVVIHIADAKRSDMLMRVTGYNDSDGACRTVYIDKGGKHSGKYGRWCNPVEDLLDPRKFGLLRFAEPVTAKPEGS